jgi:hypothetical protein
MMINDMSQSPLKYGSPYQVTMATSISTYKLTNLINVGIIKAKRIDAHTVLIDWDSVQRYLNSLPDATYSKAPQPKENIQPQATDLFVNAK